MAASSDLRSASPGRSAGSERTQESTYNADDVTDDDFGSFAAAEPVSDPFGDIYGSEADFGEFVGGSEGQEVSSGLCTSMERSSLMSFSPLIAPVTYTGPPTLLPSISGEIDPFADVTGGFGATTSNSENQNNLKQIIDKVEGNLTNEMEIGALNSTRTGNLDMVWSTRTPETERKSSTLSTRSVDSATSQIASMSRNFVVFPPSSTSDSRTNDLLSFSPLQATAPTDPFFGLENDTNGIIVTGQASDTDNVLTTTATPPPSTSSSTSTSLRGSFHDDIHTPSLSTSFTARMTQSLGLSSSFGVSMEATDDIVGSKTSFGTLPSASPETTSSISAPSSLQSSDAMISFVATGNEENEMDPFAAAGLAAPEEVPLAEALAAWTTAVDSTGEVNENDDQDGNKTENQSVVKIMDVTDQMMPERLMESVTIGTERSDNDEIDGDFTTEEQTVGVLSSTATMASSMKDLVNDSSSSLNTNDREAHGFENEALDDEGRSVATERDGENDLSAFDGVESATACRNPPSVMSDASPWGMFSSSLEQKETVEENDEFGDFAESAPMSVIGHSFGDFAWNAEPSEENDEFGDFGDFEPSDSTAFDDFQQASGANDTGFSAFNEAIAPVKQPSLSLTKSELSAFFEAAFPTKEVPKNTLSDESTSEMEVQDTDSTLESSMEVIVDVFRSIWNEFVVIVARLDEAPSSPSNSLTKVEESNDTGQCLASERKTTRASKYLKYVLSEKIQEAAKQNGIFTHGSERHQMYVGLAASGDAASMEAALKELQDALFHHSVHEAMMRIAKQAALSAKAKIAEQAAQQQGTSRGGSLFSTTRHLLLSRSNGGSGYGPGSNGSDIKAELGGADTPTGASVHKSARYLLTSSHQEATTSHRSEERGSEGSDHTGHSSGSDSEVVDPRTRSQTVASSSNGSLIKKFQDRFSFASSRHRPRVVGLRKKGQTDKEVRQMELHLDAISGGLDEVKWKCALFLYDVDEVTHVAPSQIKLVAYPSNQPLTGKTDRSAITKLVKPGTIWTVDLGSTPRTRQKQH